MRYFLINWSWRDFLYESDLKQSLSLKISFTPLELFNEAFKTFSTVPRGLKLIPRVERTKMKKKLEWGKIICGTLVSEVNKRD